MRFRQIQENCLNFIYEIFYWCTRRLTSEWINALSRSDLTLELFYLHEQFLLSFHTHKVKLQLELEVHWRYRFTKQSYYRGWKNIEEIISVGHSNFTVKVE